MTNYQIIVVTDDPDLFQLVQSTLSSTQSRHRVRSDFSVIQRTRAELSSSVNHEESHALVIDNAHIEDTGFFESSFPGVPIILVDQLGLSPEPNREENPTSVQLTGADLQAQLFPLLLE